LEASVIFDVELERNLSLLTIRHYDEGTIKNLVKDKVIVLEQKTIDTVQLVLRG
jgi:aspartate kinase